MITIFTLANCVSAITDLCNEFELKFSISLSHQANERKIFSLKKGNKIPDFIFDGMTSDINGNLFIATFGGSRVMKIDPKYVISIVFYLTEIF